MLSRLERGLSQRNAEKLACLVPLQGLKQTKLSACERLGRDLRRQCSAHFTLKWWRPSEQWCEVLNRKYFIYERCTGSPDFMHQHQQWGEFPINSTCYFVLDSLVSLPSPLLFLDSIWFMHSREGGMGARGGDICLNFRPDWKQSISSMLACS